MSTQPIPPAAPFTPSHGTEVYFRANIDGRPGDENLKALFIASSTGGGDLYLINRDVPANQNPVVAHSALNFAACSDNHRDLGQPAQYAGHTGFLSVYVTDDELRVAFKPDSIVPKVQLSNKGEMEGPASYDSPPMLSGKALASPAEITIGTATR